MGLSSAVTGSEVLVGSAARATVVRASVLELAIGVIMALEDIADTPGISPDFFSGPADRWRPARAGGCLSTRQPAILWPGTEVDGTQIHALVGQMSASDGWS
jgi:hypothetical protein